MFRWFKANCFLICPLGSPLTLKYYSRYSLVISIGPRITGDITNKNENAWPRDMAEWCPPTHPKESLATGIRMDSLWLVGWGYDLLYVWINNNVSDCMCLHRIMQCTPLPLQLSVTSWNQYPSNAHVSAHVKFQQDFKGPCCIAGRVSIAKSRQMDWIYDPLTVWHGNSMVYHHKNCAYPQPASPNLRESPYPPEAAHIF